MSITRISTILGGLPVVATVLFGKDSDTPNGPGDYWFEVDEICWLKKDKSAGKPIPQSVYDRAEKYDPGFCNLIEGISDELSYEAWKERQAKGEPDMVQLL